ncbi:putative helicase mov-10-B.1 [Bradysia coprophila]|uniref:putative helicase mov-10-B.1 n=1 Tax=Bradysia coprophila TaxID=38358 RepID=UPI00187DC1A8|nr:putative helicase mov-10-B.1 [Bradysia coprophila]
MDEKQRVISALRVLLVRSSRKDAIALHELKHDYCVLECTKEIPCFEHKDVTDFLISSGAFNVKVDTTGLVTVRGKPKSLGSHLQKLAADQKLCSSVNAVKALICQDKKQEHSSVDEMEMTQRNDSAKTTPCLAAEMNIEVNPRVKLPDDTSEPSTVFTFSELSEQLNGFVNTQNESDQEQSATSAIKTSEETVASSYHKIRTTDAGEHMDGSSQDKYPEYNDVTPVECANLVVSAVKPVPESYLEMLQFMTHQMPNRILEIERNDNISSQSIEWIKSWLVQKEHFRVSESIYIEAFRMMIFFEAAVEAIEVEAHNFPAVELVPIDNHEFYFNISANCDKLAKILAAIDDNQLARFMLLPSSTLLPFLQGRIMRRAANKIFVRIFFPQDWRCGVKYAIHFEVNQLNYQIQHSALDFIEMHRLFPILINNPLYRRQSSDASVNQGTDRFTRTDLNPEQRQAIEFIIGGSYNPLPYLLYGPPGTGKTKTIVAAIETIVRTTSKNILVCAHSNAACNEITERLAKVLSDTEMLRMLSVSHDKADISSTIKPFCNLFDGRLNYPELSYLYKFRVLICTLSVSGCLVRAYKSDPKHFSYVFIDECANACETMTLVPIAGLCTSKNKVHANIVLIGDPKQLDAVTRSDWSTQLGFKTSWFERLFDMALYQRHPESGQFNANYITQLTRNYRSHAAILRIPNEIFYDNSLEAVTEPGLINLDVHGLQSKNFPIIFQSVHGFCNKPGDSTSLFNSAEVNHVMDFVELLMQPEKHNLNQCDIGIVSPYRLQCNMIRKRCHQNGYRHITIGSTEQFQGQERKVMIMSTVRSGSGNLGDFVKNPQRFNVMITRAKSLLIVVGNPHLLSQDKNWSKFIHFCLRNGALIQDSNNVFLPEKDNDAAESSDNH